MMYSKVPSSLLEALEFFKETEQVKANPKLFGNLKTALRRYVIPGYKHLSDYQVGTLDLCQSLTEISIKQFREAETHFNASAIAIGTHPGTLANYRSALNRFIKWMQEQDWYHEAAGTYDGKYAPRMGKLGFDLTRQRKGRRQYSAKPYALKESDLTPGLREQLDKFYRFLTALEIPKRQDSPVRESTAKPYRYHILCFLGWLHHVEDWPFNELKIELIADREWLDEFIAWGINDRGNSYGWAILFGATALNVAKWQHYRRSQATKYKDIKEVEVIRALLNELSQKHRKEPRRTTSKEALEEKLITLEQCIEVIRYLRRCCAPRRSRFERVGNGRSIAGPKRPETAVMQNWQRYLLIAILTYCPVRQRELRELELGRTLFRELDGYVIKLKPEDHKTGSKTGREREFRLPPILTDDLDEWLNTWRPKVQTNHKRVFLRLNLRRIENFGEPYEGSKLGEIVVRTMYTATGHLFGEPKRTSPHDFRRIAITWQRKYGSRDQDEALAEMMGHSVREADRTYSQLTSREKTDKAVNWWKHNTQPQ
jgi:integrase